MDAPGGAGSIPTPSLALLPSSSSSSSAKANCAGATCDRDPRRRPPPTPTTKHIPPESDRIGRWSRQAMAATPFDASGPANSYAFDIYNDGQAALRPAPLLPGGPCNYTDQSLPRCGCRRFWSRLSLTGGQNPPGESLAEVCMCSHHACFHEDVQAGQPPPPPVLGVAGQENEKPRTNREPLSPVQDLGAFPVPMSLGSCMDLGLLNFQSQAGPSASSLLSLPSIPAPPEGSSMPDTLAGWADLIQSQPSLEGFPLPHSGADDGLPPIPSQCLLPYSPRPSTATSSQARFLRPFAGKGLDTLNVGPAPAGSALRNELPVTEELRVQVNHAQVSAISTVDATRESTPKPTQSQTGPSSGVSDEAFQKLAHTVDGHEQRLDRLENVSFSVAGHDDCHDKHEHVDIRVTELESRVEEVEKLLNDSGSIASSRRTVRRDGSADDATASVVSVATDATVLGAHRGELFSQLQSLQQQVSQLQAASLPSYNKPWELEVVFLPFPLKGIWMAAHEFPSQRRSTGTNGEDITQMPNTISRATPDPQSPKFQEWAGQSADSNWLLPRAFVAGRVIDQRLRSRGLIKTVLVRGPDARSVQIAIHAAFEDVFRISCGGGSRSQGRHHHPIAELLGLGLSWAPLRKLHKDARLRFLAPAEMATPALWDFTFLSSSVVMKATGTHRLYITQPEAYLQDHPLGYRAFESGWSWQKLRELSRVYPDSQSSLSDAPVPEADAMEDCWGWDDRLDESPSVNTSAVSLRQMHQHRLSRGTSASPTQQFYTGMQSPILSNTPRVRAQSPMIQRERQGSRPLNTRNNSVPPSAPIMISSSQARRWASAHTTTFDRRSSPLISRASPRPSIHTSGVQPPINALLSKRRQPTRSPSLIPRNTPRWSRHSLSRSPSLAPAAAAAAGFSDRHTTPFYYATPHSDAIPDHAYHRGARQPTNGGYDDEDTGGGGDSFMTDSCYDDDGKPTDDDDGDDEDLEIDVYEDEMDDTDTDISVTAITNNNTTAWDQPHQQHPQRPEDIPWAGIEDADDMMSEDGENVDPDSSQSQSQSQQSQGSMMGMMMIPIHEDRALGQGQDDDEMGNASEPDSQPPSEYSSKQSLWVVPRAAAAGSASLGAGTGRRRSSGGGGGGGGFRIHEDDEEEEGSSGPETQWA
ncbi:midasin [Podospora conica]|nr:midasin [Schizothecium conicum]